MLIQKIKKNISIILILVSALIIRAYKINTTPALNSDEAAIGYNVYSLLKTGLDEHGKSWPLHFTSFGDYKPGGYFYLVLPAVSIFGLTTFAVRVPNLILSIIAILYLFRLIKILTKSKQFALLSASLLCISPWHIHFSRGGWESSTALSFLIIGTFYFYQAIQNKTIETKSLVLFTLFFSFSLYTYHSTRLIAPLLALFLIVQNHKPLFQKKFIKKLILITIFGILISTPVLISFVKSGGSARFGGVGLTADSGPIWRANELINQHANTKLINRIMHNKRLLYGLSWLQKYASHFDFNFLFVNGDQVPRSKVPEMGQLYLIELPLLLLGIFQLYKSKFKKLKGLVFVWLLISPIASSLTYQAPSALRALSMVTPITIITGFGLYRTIFFIKSRFKKFIKPIFVGISCLYIYFIAYYFNSYFNLYPKINPLAWQYEFDKIIPIVQANKAKYEHIYFTTKYDQPYILYLFYSQYSPNKLHPQIKLTPADQYAFSTVDEIDNITFHIPNWSQIPPNSYIIASDEDIPQSPYQIINFQNNLPAFKIYIK